MAANHPEDHITIHDLYPGLSEDELQEADANLDLYLAFVLRVYERIRNDPEAYAHFHALLASVDPPQSGDDTSNPT